MHWARKFSTPLAGEEKPFIFFIKSPAFACD